MISFRFAIIFCICLCVLIQSTFYFQENKVFHNTDNFLKQSTNIFYRRKIAHADNQYQKHGLVPREMLVATLSFFYHSIRQHGQTHRRHLRHIALFSEWFKQSLECVQLLGGAYKQIPAQD